MYVIKNGKKVRYSHTDDMSSVLGIKEGYEVGGKKINKMWFWVYIGVGVFLLLLFIILLIVFLKKRKRRR